MEKDNKKQQKIIISRSLLFLLIVVFVLLLIFLFSLIFMCNDSSSKPPALEDNFVIKASDNLVLSKDGLDNDYFKARTYEGFTMQGITTDGFNFYKKNGDNYDLILNPNEAYFSYDIEISSKAKTEIYLDDSSFVLPYEKIYSDNVFRKNSLGNFSSDLIAASVRIAVYEVNNNEEELRTIWIPNEKYELTNDGTNYIFNEYNSNAERIQYFDNQTKSFIPYELDDYMTGFIKTSKLSFEKNGMKYINSSKSLCCFSEEDVLNNTKKTLRFKIWYEISDRDYHEELLNGLVNINIKLIDIYKDNCSDEIIKKFENIKYRYEYLMLDEIYFDTNQGFIVLYSVDGLSYTYYNKANLKELSNSYIYIKVSETFDTKESYIKKILIE